MAQLGVPPYFQWSGCALQGEFHKTTRLLSTIYSGRCTPLVTSNNNSRRTFFWHVRNGYAVISNPELQTKKVNFTHFTPSCMFTARTARFAHRNAANHLYGWNGSDDLRNVHRDRIFSPVSGKTWFCVRRTDTCGQVDNSSCTCG